MSETIKKHLEPLTCNKRVACKPLLTATSSKSAFSDWQTKNQCIELDVVFQTSQDEYAPGDKVYIRPYIDVPTFLNEVYTLGGQEVVLVPFEMIVAYNPLITVEYRL